VWGVGDENTNPSTRGTGHTHQEVGLICKDPIQAERPDAQQLVQVDARAGGLQDLDRRVDGLRVARGLWLVVCRLLCVVCGLLRVLCVALVTDSYGSESRWMRACHACMS